MPASGPTSSSTLQNMSRANSPFFWWQRTLPNARAGNERRPAKSSRDSSPIKFSAMLAEQDHLLAGKLAGRERRSGHRRRDDHHVRLRLMENPGHSSLGGILAESFVSEGFVMV